METQHGHWRPSGGGIRPAIVRAADNEPNEIPRCLRSSRLLVLAWGSFRRAIIRIPLSGTTVCAWLQQMYLLRHDVH